MKMRTAYCPKSHVRLAGHWAGDEYGHVPGHQYHDVDVVISTRGGKYRCHVVESWGSAQGYDEEHGRREVVGRGDSIRAAVSEARAGADRAGIDAGLASQALLVAADGAEEYADDLAAAE
jgi:hypothetical protein